MFTRRYIAIAAILGTLWPSLHPLFAFDPNYIISDAEMTDSASLDLNGIQRYLDRGYLGSYSTEDIDGATRSATEIIYRAAQNYELSPKFLLGMLQREQSLVDDDDPTQTQLNWAMGYAVCDVCTTSDSAIQRWRGFAKQVNSAAMQFREGYLADLEANGKTSVGIGPGIAVEIDDVIIIPANNATSALYTYTPHIHGNQNLATIWENYFTLDYPDGSLLQAAGEDGVWYIQDGLRRAITSKAALLSRFNPDYIITVEAASILKYEQGTPIAFPNYSLLRAPTGTVFLIVDDTRRGIDSSTTFAAIGFDPDEVVDVTWNDLDAYREGAHITIDSIYPQGHLLQNSATGGVYFVMDGVRHPIISKALLTINYDGWRIHPTDPTELESYPLGDKVVLPDGTLVKASDAPDVYVISNGDRLPIISADIFESMGWKWSNILTVDRSTIELHPLGDNVDSPTIDAISEAGF